jgi:hypothetical protein
MPSRVTGATREPKPAIGSGTLFIFQNVIHIVMDTRPLWFGTLLAAVLCAPALAWAPIPTATTSVAILQSDDETPAPVPRPARAHNAGIVVGDVVSVDYQRGMIGLQTPRRGRVDVVVLPSTNIQGHGNSFHTIADISRGSRLKIFLSEQAGRFIAQIIHLR